MAPVRTVDTKWFKRKLEERGMSQRQLASLMGIDHAALSLALNGKRNITVQEAAQLGNLLQTPIAEIMARTGAYAGKPGAK